MFIWKINLEPEKGKKNGDFHNTKAKKKTQRKINEENWWQKRNEQQMGGVNEEGLPEIWLDDPSQIPVWFLYSYSTSIHMCYFIKSLILTGNWFYNSCCSFYYFFISFYLTYLSNIPMQVITSGALSIIAALLSKCKVYHSLENIKNMY